MFSLQRCLCSLLCRCLPGDRKSGEGETVADAPAPVDDQPAKSSRRMEPRRETRKPA